jgi:hypothetical protein
MQNAKSQLLWNNEMQNAKNFMGAFSSIQNAKFFIGWVRVFLTFWPFFWSLETKIQNGEWIPFCQKFCMVFNFILQKDGPKLKIFWVKWGSKHTLNHSEGDLVDSTVICLTSSIKLGCQKRKLSVCMYIKKKVEWT